MRPRCLPIIQERCRVRNSHRNLFMTLLGITTLYTVVLIIFQSFFTDVLQIYARPQVFVLGTTPHNIESNTIAQPVMTRLGQSTMHPEAKLTEKRESKEYAIETPVCSIPHVNPWKQEHRELVKAISYQCKPQSDFPEFVFQRGSSLFIDHVTANRILGKPISHCILRGILREFHSDDNQFYLSNETLSFPYTIEPPFDFVHVICISEDRLVYRKILHIMRRYLPQNQPKLKAAKSRPVSVLLIGIDSVSRANLIRNMPRTRNFLTEKLKAVEFLGYNKIGDNTFPNLVAMLTGKLYEELPWHPNARETFDKYWWIWDDFAREGYQTMFAEEHPEGGTFNWAKRGFDVAPSKHYTRPMFLAMSREENGLYPTHRESKFHELCYGSKFQTEILMDYTFDFAKAYKDDPYFAYNFATLLTHDHIGMAATADGIYEKFLMNMYQNELLRNTVLIVFSDHGIRFGQYRETEEGQLEERLPFLFIYFPEHIKKQYSDVFHTFQANSKRLTTPFDVHETLKDLLLFPSKIHSPSVTHRGLSLFAPIPVNRTCDKAGIELHYCTCNGKIQVESEQQAILAARKAVESLNEKLYPFRNNCSFLRLERVERASQLVSPNNGGPNVIGIQLTLSTSPGKGLFEVTVLQDGSLGDAVSRINKYGDTSWCVDDMKLKTICYCRAQRVPPV